MPRPRATEGVRGSRPKADGRWWAYYYDARGRRRYVYGATAAERDTRLREALNLRDQGVAPERGTLGDHIASWLVQVDARPDRYAPATRKMYRYCLSLVPAWLRGRQLEDVTPEDVDDVIAGLLAEGRASATVANVRRLLITVVGRAQRRGHVGRNVASLSETVPVKEKSPEPLTLDEARALLAVLRGHRLESLYAVALAVGLRQSEAIGLLWSRVDLDGSTLTVDSQWTRDGSRRPTKAGSNRTVVLPGLCSLRLSEHRERQQFERRRAGPAWQDEGLVWPDEAGGPLKHSHLNWVLGRACGEAGIRRVTFHALRHSAATLLLAQGVPSRVIAHVLGHRGMGQLVRYQHVVPELEREAAEAMNRALGGEQ